MAVNKHLPHVLVLPEDDANRQIAIGFSLRLEGQQRKQFQILPVARGWLRVRDQVISQGVADLPERRLLLLVDFDESHDRLAFFQQNIPGDIQDRVFVLGTWSEPEDLKTAGMGNYEQIGAKLAEACRQDMKTDADWKHRLLLHNEAELARLRESVRAILFC